MKRLLVAWMALAGLPAFCETNYIYYVVADGRVEEVAPAYRYNPDSDVLTLGNATMSGINWAAMRLDVTTNALSGGLSNISQVASHSRVLPLTEEEKTDFTNWGDKRLEAVAKALLDLINSRVPSGQQITEDQLKQAVRSRLDR